MDVVEIHTTDDIYNPVENDQYGDFHYVISVCRRDREGVNQPEEPIGDSVDWTRPYRGGNTGRRTRAKYSGQLAR
ncbi:hypothetical protein GCM10027563_09790 [Parasphingorhabdus pacifica]